MAQDVDESSASAAVAATAAIPAATVGAGASAATSAGENVASENASSPLSGDPVTLAPSSAPIDSSQAAARGVSAEDEAECHAQYMDDMETCNVGTTSRSAINSEHRIEMEVIVDAYTKEECALSWYYYLEEQLSLPFPANVRKAMASSPLLAGEQVSVTALAHEDLCRVGIFVWARWGERGVVAPLDQLVSLNSDKSTRVAVADWHYWHDQGCAF